MHIKHLPFLPLLAFYTYFHSSIHHRFSTIESLYVSTKLGQVHAMWEECAAAGSGPGGSPAAWLPGFLSRLVGQLQAEAAWAVRVLPDHAAELLRALCMAVFNKVRAAHWLPTD